ncbi:hypothetical protein M2161_007803 [Streptomyces sp. SAI-133]|uniref:hypothetical protein n=1 Tax=unclassified Streptomyces TaxID=2593676 RepID=UPI002476D870|nr:hypothetical protein [Streptomyces sp. SAI-133]MDH6588697.1 hypothetical protein [Streptomyces sp. SAI-133]
MVEPVQQFDVISMGRIGIDLHPLRSGAPPARTRSFTGSVSGAAAHVAVAARAGAGSVGARLHQTLTEPGVFAGHRRRPA